MIFQYGMMKHVVNFYAMYAPVNEIKKAVEKADLLSWLQTWLGYDREQELQRRAPTQFSLPGGRTRTIRYPDDGSAAIISGKLQDFFGLDEHPMIDGEAAQVELLAPTNAPANSPRTCQGSGAAATSLCAKICAAATPNTPGRKIRSIAVSINGIGNDKITRNRSVITRLLFYNFLQIAW